MADEKKSTFKDKLHAFWTVVKKCAKRVWAYLKVAKMEYIVMISLFALDLISKAIVDAAMEPGDTFPIIPYFIGIHYSLNSNAAFGASWMTSWLGPLGARIFFCVFSVAASVVFVLVLIKHKGGSKLFRIALAMLVAGAMGNCIDRWALGYVRDFLEFSFFKYIFNIADAELVIGVVLIIVYFIFVYKDKSSEKKREARRLNEQTATAAEASEANGSETVGSAEAPEANNVEATANATAETVEANENKADEAPEANNVEASDGGVSESADLSEKVEVAAAETSQNNVETGEAAQEADDNAKDGGGGEN